MSGFAPGDASLKVIWRLTWPQMIMMLFHFLIGFTDVWVAGRIHPDVQASLGLVTQCLFFLLVVAVATANAAVAAVSQAIGAGMADRARRYVGLVLVGGTLMGALLALVGYVLREPFLKLLMVPEQILPITSYFWDVYLFGLPANYLFTISNAVFRARKEVLVPLVTMIAVCVVNAVADMGFGLGLWGLPNYGAQGVAWATFSSVLLGAIINVVMLRRTGLMRRSSLPRWRWVKYGAPSLMRVAAPAGAMQLLWHLGYLVLFVITGALPVDAINALAGLTAGMRVESILFLPAFAFNMSASVLVGHFVGAGQKAEAKRVGLVLLGAGCGLMSTCAVFLWPWIPELSAFLAPDPAVQAQTIKYLRYNVLSIPFTVASMTLGGIMTGAGAAMYNFIVYSSATWLVRLPMAWLLGHVLWRDASGVFIAMLVSQMFQSSVMFWLFMYKDWSRFSLIRRTVANGAPKESRL